MLFGWNVPIDVKAKERRRYRANVFLQNKRGSTKSIQEVPRNDKGRYDEKDMKWVTNDELVVCLRFSIHEEAPLNHFGNDNLFSYGYTSAFKE